MKTKQKEIKGKNSKNNRFYTSFPFIALSILIIVAVLFFAWHQKSLKQTTLQQEIFSQDLTDDIAVPEQVGGETNTPLSTQNTTIIDGQKNNKASINDSEEQTGSELPLYGTIETQKNSKISNLAENFQASSGKSTTNSSSPLPSDKRDKTFQNAQCQESTKFIEGFFQHLDSQQYLKKYNIEPDSKTYFIELMQKTLDNPPVVSGETDDLYTILQNTAHFFRIIGNTNIGILKNILSNEKAQFENIAAEFYSLVTSEACAEKNFGLRINKPSLYEYAGFFLNTMGGRLYLFRRDSISRMVISYYSILLIDKANIESFNKHGIELSTSIDLLISEMESTTNTLKLKETYLNTLYALQEQYQ